MRGYVYFLNFKLFKYKKKSFKKFMVGLDKAWPNLRTKNLNDWCFFLIVGLLFK